MTAAPHLHALARRLARRLRHGPADLPPGGPRRRAALERDGIRVSLTRLQRYLRATGAERIRAFGEVDPVLPPLLPVIWEGSLAAELLSESDLPLIGLIHRGGETVRPRPLRLGDPVRCRVELDRAEPHPLGTRLHIIARSWNAQGHLCSESSLDLLTRAPDRTALRTPRLHASPSDDGAWRHLAEWRLSSRSGWSYALASGDYNPIHLSSWTARPFGFRRPILHGFCTEALVAHALVEHRWGGDPAALRRLRIRFRAPLMLPGHASLRVAEMERGGRFQVVGPAGELFADGEFGGG